MRHGRHGCCIYLQTLLPRCWVALDLSAIVPPPGFGNRGADASPCRQVLSLAVLVAMPAISGAETIRKARVLNLDNLAVDQSEQDGSTANRDCTQCVPASVEHSPGSLDHADLPSESDQGTGDSCTPGPDLTRVAMDFRDGLDGLFSLRGSLWERAHSHWLSRSSSKAMRMRDLLPMPPMPSWPDTLDIGEQGNLAMFATTNFSILALNLLHVDYKVTRMTPCGGRAPSQVQSGAQLHLAARCLHSLVRVAKACGGNLSWKGAFRTFESTNEPLYQELKHDAVDLPSRAGTCDPMKIVSKELREAIGSAPQFSHATSDRTCPDT